MSGVQCPKSRAWTELAQWFCGFAAAQCGKASPFRQVHFLFSRLCLGAAYGGAASKKLERASRYGVAVPHCAAAQPQEQTPRSKSDASRLHSSSSRSSNSSASPSSSNSSPSRLSMITWRPRVEGIQLSTCALSILVRSVPFVCQSLTQNVRVSP